ncbi:hypothetical protein YC2023_121081 [Brassica napus]
MSLYVFVLCKGRTKELESCGNYNEKGSGIRTPLTSKRDQDSIRTIGPFDSCLINNAPSDQKEKNAYGLTKKKKRVRYGVPLVFGSSSPPSSSTKFDSDREFNQRKINDVGNNIFRTQRYNQFPVDKNGLLLMNKIEYNE